MNNFSYQRSSVKTAAIAGAAQVAGTKFLTGGEVNVQSGIAQSASSYVAPAIAGMTLFFGDSDLETVIWRER